MVQATGMLELRTFPSQVHTRPEHIRRQLVIKVMLTDRHTANNNRNQRRRSIDVVTTRKTTAVERRLTP